MTTERSQEFITAALYLSRCGRRVNGETPLPPAELGTDHWQSAYAVFFDHLGAGRTFRSFCNSLKASRDQFDSHVDSGRRGWRVGGKPKPLPEQDALVLARWRLRTDQELWGDVRPFADLAASSLPTSVLNDLDSESDADEETVMVGREGRLKAVISRRRERSPRLRAAALKTHGCRCQVCAFDFEVAYGKWGKAFAEVHHMRELHAAGDHGVETNVMTDLVVLCSKGASLDSGMSRRLMKCVPHGLPPA